MANSGTKILFGFLFFVTLAAGLAGAGAWYLTESRVEGYQASAILLLSPQDNGYGPLPFSQAVAGPEDALRNRLEEALGLGAANTTPVSSAIAAPDYAALFSSDHMAAALQDRLAAYYTEQGGEAKAWTLEDVRAAMATEAQVALQTRDNVVYRRLITLNFTAETPELAAAVANTWAEAARNYSKQLEVSARKGRLDVIRPRLDALRAELAAAQEKQDALRQGPPLESLEQAALERNEATRTLKAEIQSLEQSLARDEAALSTLKTYLSKAPVAVVLELSVREADMDAAVAGTRAERDYLAGKVASAEALQANAQAQWADARRNHEAVSSTIEGLTPQVAALEQALFAASQEGPGLRIAAPAVAPETPVGPMRYIVVAGAALLGAILGMIVYFALLTLRVYARELDRS
ncbi:MAG: hypothetical protein L3K26_02005 [Candidatus Hydrogenedentes bacterium]|nr:hypothetical protein [Candidatus Hydrogenedentota bacterium]